MQVLVYTARETISRDTVERLNTAQQQEETRESLHNHHCHQKNSIASSEDRRCSQQHFATFPLIRSTPTLTRPAAATTATDDAMTSLLRHHKPLHDDVITTLMITHSGEPIGVGLNHPSHSYSYHHQGDVVDRPLSVPVTVPEPTSFHQDGSQIRQQLLDHHRSSYKKLLASNCNLTKKVKKGGK